MQINGHNMAVEIDGEGAPVLLVHGLGGTSNFYQVQVDDLADDFQLIRPDLAGAGRSELADTITIESHAEDLATLLDELGTGPATVVGHSMGTLVVRTLADRRPDLVRGLVLLGAVGVPAEAGRQASRDRAALVREKGTVAAAAGIVANALSPKTHEQRPEVAAFVRELIMRQDDEGYARNCEALAGAGDPGPVASEIRLLLITGSDDKVGAPAVSEALAENHGDARVEVLPGIGHWTALEAAVQVTDLLREFL